MTNRYRLPFSVCTCHPIYALRISPAWHRVSNGTLCVSRWKVGGKNSEWAGAKVLGFAIAHERTATKLLTLSVSLIYMYTKAK